MPLNSLNVCFADFLEMLDLLRDRQFVGDGRVVKRFHSPAAPTSSHYGPVLTSSSLSNSGDLKRKRAAAAVNAARFVPSQATVNRLFFRRSTAVAMRGSKGGLEILHSSSQLRSLAPDSKTTLQKRSKSAINCLSLDLVNQRFLISAADTLSIYDLEANVDELQPMQRNNSSQRLLNPVVHLERAAGFPDFHRYAVTAAHWFPFDTGIFTTSSMDGTVKVWDANALAVAVTFKLEGKVYSHALSPVATSNNLIASKLGEE